MLNPGVQIFSSWRN